MNQGPQSHNCKEMNSANNLNELGSRSLSKTGRASAQISGTSLYLSIELVAQLFTEVWETEPAFSFWGSKEMVASNKISSFVPNSFNPFPFDTNRINQNQPAQKPDVHPQELSLQWEDRQPFQFQQLEHSKWQRQGRESLYVRKPRLASLCPLCLFLKELGVDSFWGWGEQIILSGLGLIPIQGLLVNQVYLLEWTKFSYPNSLPNIPSSRCCWFN